MPKCEITTLEQLAGFMEELHKPLCFFEEYGKYYIQSQPLTRDEINKAAFYCVVQPIVSRNH